ncbi:hypothetical protein ACU8OS_35290 (plasmid) [Rhizobium leguminosarum]
MTFRNDLFGPQTEAKVTIANGTAQSIEIRHPNRKSSITIPGDWASELVGSDGEILADVSRSLNGAKVVKALPSQIIYLENS